MNLVSKALVFWYVKCPAPRVWRWVTDKLEEMAAKSYK